MKCPDCGDRMSYGAIACACGWRKKESNGNDPEKCRCGYTTDGRRCKLNGTFSQSTKGEGPWYCPWHDNVLNRSGNIASNKGEFYKFAEQRWPKENAELLWHLANNFNGVAPSFSDPEAMAEREAIQKETT